MSGVTGHRKWNVLLTGGAGYVGSALVPKLLAAGHWVTVLDLYLYGEEVLAPVAGHPGLTEIKGDLRDGETVARALSGCDAVIHLACISNDPSFELDPALGKSINFDAFRPLVRAARDAGAACHGPLDQGDFLRRIGIETRMERLCAAALPEAAAAIRSGGNRLIDAREMGTLFKAMALTSPGAPPPAGFEP